MSTNMNSEDSFNYLRKISDDNQRQKKINILSSITKQKKPLKGKLYLECRPFPTKANKHRRFDSNINYYQKGHENFDILKQKKKYPSLSPQNFNGKTGFLEMKTISNNGEKPESFLPPINLKTNETNYFDDHAKIKLSKIKKSKFYATSKNFIIKNNENNNESIKTENKQKFKIIKDKNCENFRKVSDKDIPIFNSESINFNPLNLESNFNGDEKFIDVIKIVNENSIKEKAPIEEQKLILQDEEKERNSILNINANEYDNEKFDNKAEKKTKKKHVKIFLANNKNIANEEKYKEVNKEMLNNEKENINDSESKPEPIKNNFLSKSCPKEFLNNYLLNNIEINSACLTKEGISNSESKINQDSYLILENIFKSNFYIFGIYDGHGSNGHLISKYVSQYMNEFFLSEENYKDLFSELKDKEKFNELFLEKSIDMIKNCQKKLDETLLNEKLDFDIKLSGTTNLMLFIIDNKLICSNIGDSRCVLFTCSQEDKWDFEELSIDHKPSDENEKERILKMGGEVHPYYDRNGNFEGPDRIYEKGKPYPGLSLSRTVGDLEGKKIGIISEPEIIFKNFDESFKYIVMGSDGLWDQMRPYDIIRIVRPFFRKKNPEGACQAILKRVIQIWDRSDDERDDITIMVIFIGK